MRLIGILLLAVAGLIAVQQPGVDAKPAQKQCKCTACSINCLCDADGACKEPEPPEIESALDVYTAAYEAAKTRTVKVGKGCEFELNPAELPANIRKAFRGDRITLQPGEQSEVRIVRPQASVRRSAVAC